MDAQTKLVLLKSLDFGQSVAEQERVQLHKYFVKTKDWETLIDGAVDVVYGPKGSGKSALYTLLDENEQLLASRNIITRFAENPRGATAFADLQTNPPAKELEFVNLWKLYLLTILGNYLSKAEAMTFEGLEVVEALNESKLLDRSDSAIEVFLSKARAYIKKWFDPISFEPKLAVNETTGMPESFSVKVTFREPSQSAPDHAALSVNSLLKKADHELKSRGLTIWFLLDRLYVAFADSLELEANALRALFKVYLDFTALSSVKLKIFLRSDIWGRITMYGFREATHITRKTTIQWEPKTLLNLIMRRFLSNESFNRELGLNSTEVLASIEKQQDTFERIFPNKVDSGKNPLTLDWIIGRTQDAKGNYCPRDIINLINHAISTQIRLLEAGAGELAGEQLFDRSVIKSGLTDTSKEKVEKQLFAEYPSYRKYLEALRGRKAEQNLESLCSIWNTPNHKTLAIAQDLIDIGFWLREGSVGNYHYWIPFIYRQGLGLVQGQAD